MHIAFKLCAIYKYPWLNYYSIDSVGTVQEVIVRQVSHWTKPEAEVSCMSLTAVHNNSLKIPTLSIIRKNKMCYKSLEIGSYMGVIIISEYLCTCCQLSDVEIIFMYPLRQNNC